MSADLMVWLALAAKLALTAGFVVAVALIAERAGPLVGAMVATLPVAGGPAYVFLALEHDAAFIAESALASLTSNAANMLFCAIYTWLAQRRSLAVSLGGAIGAWITCAFLLPRYDWSLAEAILLNLAVFIACLPLARRYRDAPMPRASRRWYDLPLRAFLVSTLVIAVVAISAGIGPVLTGIIALFPVVLTSLTLIFHPRIGGIATAGITANGISGLAGFGVALTVLHLLALPAGTWIAMTLALAMSIAWNLGNLVLHRRAASSESR